MEGNDKVASGRSPEDEVDMKIEALEAELASVSSKEDKKILWGALGIFVFVILYKLLHFDPIVFIVVVPAVVFGGITMVIHENMRKKKNILISHGLRCDQCGHIPRPVNASGLYYSNECPKCRTRLEI